MKEKLQQFMLGRYGADNLSRFMAGVSFMLLILSMIFRSDVLALATILLLFLNYFRIFSRNCNKRYQENNKFLALKHKLQIYSSEQKSKIDSKKTHHIYKCPKCRQKIRVPKGKGKICITCPGCKNEFIKKS